MSCVIRKPVFGVSDQVEKRPGRPKKAWDEVLVDDRRKLGKDFADPQNRSE